MAQSIAIPRTLVRQAFSRIEILPVVIFVGILTAAVGTSYSLRSLERGKASQAFEFLHCVHHAQRDFFASHGRYADEIGKLDLEQHDPAYFSVGEITSARCGSFNDSWSLTLTRRGGMTSGYGAYRITFTDNGYDIVNSDIHPDIAP